MGNGPYTDLERPPLRASALRRALLVPDGLWSDLRVTAETGSTNADVAAEARDGAPEGLVLVAERQTAGRGRQGRVWESPARAGIAVSVLLRPAGIDPARYGWLPLLAGVALVETVRRIAEVDAVLKWPNDLLIDERKCAGILAEVADPGAVVVGIGLNTTTRNSELPHPGATSLALAGAACADRDPLLRALLRTFAARYVQWRDAGGDAEGSGLREAYAFHCATLGREVSVHLPDGTELRGLAEAVDLDGRLVVAGHALAAGDVAHLR
jgi:BirA family biotin operon repressor/biotin-[acetyl-CoA-carboxylase] ligase